MRFTKLARVVNLERHRPTLRTERSAWMGWSEAGRKSPIREWDPRQLVGSHFAGSGAAALQQLWQPQPLRLPRVAHSRLPAAGAERAAARQFTMFRLAIGQRPDELSHQLSISGGVGAIAREIGSPSQRQRLRQGVRRGRRDVGRSRSGFCAPSAVHANRTLQFRDVCGQLRRFWQRRGVGR